MGQRLIWKIYGELDGNSGVQSNRRIPLAGCVEFVVVALHLTPWSVVSKQKSHERG